MIETIFIGILIFFIACSGYIVSRRIKRCKSELEDTKKNFALAMDAGSISAWKYDIEQKYFTPLMGDVIAGQGFSWDDSLKILHPDDHAPLTQLFDDMCAGKQEGGEIVLRYFSPEYGDYRYYESKMNVRRGKEGDSNRIIGTQRDITEKCLRKLELENARKSIDLAMSAAEITAWDYDIKSRRFRTLYGDFVLEKQASLIDSFDLIHPDDVQDYTQFVQELIKNEDSNTASTTIRICKDGTNYRYFNCIISVVRNSKGEATYLIGSLLDITQRKRSEMLIKQNEHFLNLILDNIPFPIHLKDVKDNYRYLYWNKASTDMFGDAAFKSAVDVVGDEQAKAIYEIDKKVYETGEPYYGQETIVTIDGRTYETLVHKGLIFDGDREIIFVVRWDISDLLQLQHKLELANKRDELIINNINSGIAYIDSNYTVQWENMASCSASLSYEAYKTGEYCYKSAHGRNEPCENCVMQRALQSRQVEQIEFTFDNGKSVEVFATPVFSPTDEIEGVVIRVDNITERKIMITALEQSKEQAEESDRLKSAFLANMSHEIRTPLNAIVGFSDLLLATNDEEEKQEYGNIITANNELLLQLIGDILDLSKMESGTFNLVPQEVDIALLFNDLVTTMRQRVKAGVELICDNPYASCIATLDSGRLSQVVTNFVTNAIKFTTQGYIKMGYGYAQGGIYVYVTDTGIGISKEKQSKVFDRFEKLNDFAQGTGLGLSICKAIVEAQNGKIGVDSTEGVGSTFWAWVPFEVVINDKPADEVNTSEEQKLAKCIVLPFFQNVNSDKKSILVAEDIDSNYLLVSSILQEEYNLVRVANGSKAVEAMKNHSFDVVLMDMKMPLMNGLEATQHIRKFDPHTPIIALTAHAFDSDRKAALAAGCNEYVVKPINSKQLLDVLGKYI